METLTPLTSVSSVVSLPPLGLSFILCCFFISLFIPFYLLFVLIFSALCFPGLLLTSASKTPSVPSSSDFLSFSDSSLRPGGGTTFSSPPSFSSCLVKPSSEGGVSEGTTTLFGSLASANTASAGDNHLCIALLKYFRFGGDHVLDYLII